MEKKSKYCCPLTGKYFCIRQMLLFKEMNNILICDVNAKVTEKGVWCNSNRNDIEKAIKNKVFDRLLNKKLKIPSFFIESIESNLKLKILNLLGLSKKAGLLEIGYDKVLKGIKDETVDVVLIDKEADKLKTLFIENSDKNIISLYRCFSREEIGKAIGYKKVLCVALIASKLSNALKLDFCRLKEFKCD